MTEAFCKGTTAPVGNSSPLMQLRGLPAKGHDGDFASISAECLQHACLSVEPKNLVRLQPERMLI